MQYYEAFVYLQKWVNSKIKYKAHRTGKQETTQCKNRSHAVEGWVLMVYMSTCSGRELGGNYLKIHIFCLYSTKQTLST